MESKLLEKLARTKEELKEIIAESEAKRDFSKLTPKNILIIDDSKETCLLLNEILKKVPKFNVKYLMDELRVLREVHCFKPDLIILDIQLPNIDGIKISQIVSAYSVYKIPVLFISANNTYRKEIEEQFKNHQPDIQFLPKPINREALFDHIFHMIGDKSVKH